MKNNSGHTTEEIKEFFPFEKAREYVRKLGMKGSIEYREWASSEEKPDYIPVHPDRLYKDEGWINWGDWLDYEETV
jgi:hypothetical protein